MKYLSALLVVLAVFTLGTTTLATTATAGEIYAPHNWDTGDGGIVSYGDPDSGGGGNIHSDGTQITYRNAPSPRTDFQRFAANWMLMRAVLLETLIRRSMHQW